MRRSTATPDGFRPAAVRRGDYTGLCRFRAMSDHVIRLGNAWELPAAGGGHGGARWRRRFGRPAGLAPGDRVLLVVDRPRLAAAVALNHGPLPAIEPADRWSHDVTSLLADRNELVLDLAAAEPAEPATRGGPTGGRGPLPEAAGAVLLEIVSAAGGRPRD